MSQSRFGAGLVVAAIAMWRACSPIAHPIPDASRPWPDAEIPARPGAGDDDGSRSNAAIGDTTGGGGIGGIAADASAADAGAIGETTGTGEAVPSPAELTPR